MTGAGDDQRGVQEAAAGEGASEALNAELVASKEQREKAARQKRAARESAAFALKHRLPLERLVEPQPRSLTVSAGFIRPSPSPEDRARRADEILESFGVRRSLRRSKTPSPERIVRQSGAVLGVH